MRRPGARSRIWIVTALVVAALGLLVAEPATAVEQRAVILIPGFKAALGAGTPMETALMNAGFDVQIANVGDMSGSFRSAAKAINAQGLALRKAGYVSVDLVGFSAGGLAARAAVTYKPAGTATKVFRRVITVASPLQGADLSALGDGWAKHCGTAVACAQMKPGSDFLRKLPALPRGVNAPVFYSLWTQDDLVVVPHATSQPAGVMAVHVQQACPGIQNHWTGHESLMSSAFVDLTVQALTGRVDSTVSEYGCSLPSPSRPFALWR